MDFVSGTPAPAANRVPLRQAGGSGQGGEPFEALEASAEVAAAEADPEMIAGIAEARRGENQHAFAAHQLVGEWVDLAAKQLGEADAARARPSPAEALAVAREERVEQLQVAANNLHRAGKDNAARAQRDEGEDLARCAVAERRVVLERCEPRAQRRIAGRDPTDAKAGEAEGFGHDAETERARRGVGGRGERRRVMFEESIYLVGEEMGAVQLGDRHEPRLIGRRD